MREGLLRADQIITDYAAIIKKLTNVDWNDQIKGDFMTSYGNFCIELEKAMGGSVPESRHARKSKKLFFTLEATRLKNLKRKLWRCYVKDRTNYDRERYINVKNRVRSLTRKLRKDFENNLAENVKTSPKSFWSYVKSRTKTRSSIPMLKKEDGSDAITPQEKAETLNKKILLFSGL